MNNRMIVRNGIIAALYIAMCALIQPLAFQQIQLRIPEMFNHLVVFNKKYFYGIIVGVFLANLFFSPNGVMDLYFGVGQSAVALFITIITGKFIKNILARMVVNTIVFTFTMFLIAWELNIVAHLPFMETWAVVAAGEFIVMVIGVPVMYAIHKRIDLEKLIEK
ncbi:QueT transporter family protein [Bacillus massilinigeriensis]|uniref:QueT transporter family protein n=1 Tax=Bacillus mediterraneensis TaxID=1805474 RepID=UPI0008F93BD6|nr:QueT transporter family protein [Bacillus mediterraneensis]